MSHYHMVGNKATSSVVMEINKITTQFWLEAMTKPCPDIANFKRRHGIFFLMLLGDKINV